ncbi:MAG: ORF6N domain-containing protein [Flavobacteriales bacterium]|nr:ORF6N domain-containing protein [Flavobacteriales bacterium]
MSKLLKIDNTSIENRIFNIRRLYVMVDYHLAELFQVETKRLNEQVKRNNKRFPASFMFQLTNEEWDTLQSQIATAEQQQNLQSQIATTKRRTLPYVFTEQGVAMLSAVLNSDVAVLMSVQIMEAFVKMRQLLQTNALIQLRLDKLEQNQLLTNQKVEQVFKALESKQELPTQGVFFDGQVFDAYELASKIIRSAKKNIILIDNYIDESTLTLLAKKTKDVNVLLLAKTISKQLSLDVKKANEQYGNFVIKPFTKSHDRFLIIDNQEVYHLGASLKDLGKKWFAFSKLNTQTVQNLLNAIAND